MMHDTITSGNFETLSHIFNPQGSLSNDDADA